ncbi:hypothetical protein [Parasedimentitalea huanghaiensis]|uniref:Uncharacterized protein n=1 Tax=Parasedimentitalea huanghaiensis TaxID=2682100 RepID=A0A6L6WLA9_9RHOB|nr:hypothetical protein [Zongyanglinia huanghaiensis]MVO17395.1 hypothetical protein [Zongyanglinia huanghaiensis]
MTEPTPEEQIMLQQQEGHKFSRMAAFSVSLMSGFFVIGLLAYLFYTAHLHSTQFYALTAALKSEPGEAIHPSQLELVYQRMKAMRFGDALIYRFSLSAAAIVVSLATIVLGSVLIFDRVASETKSTAGVKAGDQDVALSAGSPFPGLIMVFMGSLTLALSVYFGGPGAPVVRITDLPVFTSDINFKRNALGVRSTMAINPDELPSGEPEGKSSLLPNAMLDEESATFDDPGLGGN